MNVILDFILAHTPLLYSVISVLITLLLGFILQKRVYPRLRKRFARSKNRNARMIVRTLESFTNSWLFLGLAFTIIALNNYPNKVEIGITWAIIVLTIISLTFFIDRFATEFVDFYIRKGRIPKTSIFQTVTRITVIFLGIFTILSFSGVSIGALVATLGIGGLAIALALQPTFANVFSGMFLLATKQINIGDYVELGTDTEGYIEDINWRTTSIRTVQNNLIIIPNSNIANITIRNYSYPETEMSLVVTVGVHYDSDLNHVEQVTLAVAANIQATMEGAVRNFEPRVRYKEFGDSSINMNVVLRISEFTNRFLIRHEFIKQLHEAYNQENITIPFPIRTLEFADNSLQQLLEDRKNQ